MKLFMTLTKMLRRRDFPSKEMTIWWNNPLNLEKKPTKKHLNAKKTCDFHDFPSNVFQGSHQKL